MFINFWYPAAESKELEGKPLHCTMLGQDFVLFRDDEGCPVCLPDVCIHRGAALSEGKIKGGAIECPYHGWRFSSDGECMGIPSLGRDANAPKRAHTDSYPVKERYGLVFVFLGDLPEAERPPLMEIPEYEDSDWRATRLRLDWAVDYQCFSENLLDPAHNEFVHPSVGFSGERDDYHVPELVLKKVPWGVSCTNQFFVPPLSETKMRPFRSQEGFMQVAFGHCGPAQNWVHIHPTDEFKVHQYIFTTPKDDSHITAFLISMRNALLESADDMRFESRNIYLAEQDRLVLEGIKPSLSQFDQEKSISIPADAAIEHYRKALQQWQNNGWRIDTGKIRAAGRRMAYAIPSPARNHSKSWVLDAMPLIPARKEAAFSSNEAAE